MSKEHSYAYEAGYRDGSINYELEHCPACKNVADLQEALAENAKLREEAESWRRLTWGLELPEYPFNRLRWEELERENDKLRKLVRDLMPIVCEGCHERLCDMPKEEHPFVECLFDRRMRELGVEVGDA